MAKYTAINPFAIFLSQTGTGLNGGKIYIGVAGQDPETNPITVYWDEDFTDPADQPLTTAGGYIMRTGSPAAAYPASDTYSIRVLDRFDRQVFYEESANAALANVILSGNINLGNLPSGSTNGIDISRTANQGSVDGTTQFYSLVNRVYALGANDYEFVRAHYSGTHIQTTAGTTFQADSIHAYVWLSGAGSVDYVQGIASHVRVDGPGDINIEAVNFRAVSTTLGATGSILTIKGFSAGDLGHATKVTNAFQFYAEDTSATTLAVGFYSNVDSGTGKFAFMGAGSAPIVMNGNLGVGAITAPPWKLTVKGSANTYAADISNDHASGPFGLNIRFTATAPDNTNNVFVACADNVGEKFSVRSNGAVFIRGTQVLEGRKTGLPGAATDPATTMALVNALRTALISHGLIS